MRTAIARRHLTQHDSRWWIGHALAALAEVLLVLYAAAVVLALASRFLV
jgi:hypothetical protein